MTAEYSKLPVDVQKVFMRVLSELTNYGIAMADSTVLLDISHELGVVVEEYWKEFQVCVVEQTEKWEAVHLGVESENKKARYLLVFETRWKYKIQKMLKNFLASEGEEQKVRNPGCAWT